MNLAGEEGSDGEADLTVNNVTGVVMGRVSATDGTVYLVQKEGKGHTWAKLDDKGMLDEEEKELQDVRKVFHVTDLFCFHCLLLLLMLTFSSFF